MLLLLRSVSFFLSFFDYPDAMTSTRVPLRVDDLIYSKSGAGKVKQPAFSTIKEHAKLDGAHRMSTGVSSHVQRWLGRDLEIRGQETPKKKLPA